MIFSSPLSTHILKNFCNPCQSCEKLGWKESLTNAQLQKLMATIKLTESSTNPSSNLRRECVDEIKNELYGNFVELAPRELNILSDLARSDSIFNSLGANSTKLPYNSFLISSTHSLRRLEDGFVELSVNLIVAINFCN